MMADLYVFSSLQSHVLLPFSFSPWTPYVSPSFRLYGDVAWRERLTPRPLMSFLDTQDLLTNSSSSSAPSGDLGVGGWEGGGAKGHRWSKMMHMLRVSNEIVDREMIFDILQSCKWMYCKWASCLSLWLFLGPHSVYTLRLCSVGDCILEGLVMNRWCWQWWNDYMRIWCSLAPMLLSFGFCSKWWCKTA